MYSIRLWSARRANWLHAIYRVLERLLTGLSPLFERIGHMRLEKSFVATERSVKGLLFDSKSCGQCVLGDTGLSCPMNCPKTLRNGPCGGVRPDGKCEVLPTMKCVWVAAWEGSVQLGSRGGGILRVQPPVDIRLQGSSSWLREIRRRHGSTGNEPNHVV